MADLTPQQFSPYYHHVPTIPDHHRTLTPRRQTFIRDTRMTVFDVLEQLAYGMSEDAIKLLPLPQLPFFVVIPNASAA